MTDALHAASEDRQERATIRVVAFGNSLTYGSHDYPRDPESRYTVWLARQARAWAEARDLSVHLEFRNFGVPGDVTAGFVRRFEPQVFDNPPFGEGTPPEVLILLGGTNDLGWGVSPAEILANLRQMWDRAREAGLFLIPCLVPPARAEDPRGSYARQKQEVNAGICAYGEGHGLPVVDLHAGMADQTGSLARQYDWGDGLHFSVAGYRRMGQLVFEQAFLAYVERRLTRRALRSS